MASTSLRKASLQSMEAEIESLLKSLEGLKSDASDESRKTLKNLKANAESALSHSRSLLSDVYEDVKVKTRETSVATRDYAQEHPWTTAGVAVGAVGLLAAYLLFKRGNRLKSNQLRAFPNVSAHFLTSWLMIERARQRHVWEPRAPVAPGFR